MTYFYIQSQNIEISSYYKIWPTPYHHKKNATTHHKTGLVLGRLINYEEEFD